MRNQGNGKRRMKSDETLFSIIECLREADGAGVTEVADHLGIAKSTAHGHLVTMQDYGYVSKQGDIYQLGLQFFHVGQYVRSQFRIYTAAKTAIDELAESLGEMVWLLGHEGDRVMYLYGNNSGTGVNEDSLIGSWANMHSNSGGKAILAHLSEPEIEHILDQSGLPRKTPNTITHREELYSELEQIQEQGYSLNLGEDIKGIHAVSVPLVFDEQVHGAIAVAGSAHRLTEERCKSQIAEKLFALRDDIELNLTLG